MTYASDPASAPPRLLAWVAVLAAIALFPTIGWRPLEANDSMRFPEVAREILETGDWHVMHLHGVPYLLKPPLQFWIVAALGSIGGEIRPWMARLPAALGAWGMVLLTFWIGRRLLGWRAALIAAGALLSGALFFMLSQMTRLDPAFACCCTAAMALYLYWRDLPEAFVGRSGLARVAAVYACLGIGTLIKGPQGLLFVLPTIVADCAWRRSWRFFHPANLALGLTVYLALLSVWLAPAVQHVGLARMQDLAGDEIGDRVKGGSNYEAPWWHYFANLPIDMLPATFWLPLAVYLGLVRTERSSAPPWPIVFWAALPLVLFSLAVSKNTRYLFPALPAYALLLGWLLARPWERAVDDGWRLDAFTLWWARVLPLASIAAGLSLPFYFAREGPLALVLPGCLLLLVGAVWLLRGDLRRLYLGSLAWTLLLALIFYQMRSVNTPQRLIDRGSYRAAAEKLRAAAGDRPVVSWRFGEESLEFYYGRILHQVDTVDDLVAFLKANPDGRVIAMPDMATEIRRVAGFRLEIELAVNDRRKQPYWLLRPEREPE